MTGMMGAKSKRILRITGMMLVTCCRWVRKHGPAAIGFFTIFQWAPCFAFKVCLMPWLSGMIGFPPF